MTPSAPLPRVVIAAAASGQGKTTVAVGLMAALRADGHAVQGAKVGPDYIDPGYHTLATGRPGRNLDPWLVGEDRILPLLRHGALTPAPADLTVIEGVMGLFDGRLGTAGWASTAHIATLTVSPVILVIDISSAARTVAATVHGLTTFDPDVHVAGVILNKAGSARHADEVRSSLEQRGIRVLGVLPREAGICVPSRHLGLVPVAERSDAASALARLAEQTAEFIDLGAIAEIAGSAPPVAGDPWQSPRSTAPRTAGAAPVVAVAGGRAFSFRYAETEEILRALGCETVVFDPASDRSLPSGTRGIYLGGGFPEVHASALSTNTALRAEIREAVRCGVPTVAECAGLLYLCEAVDGHPMVGAVAASAAMSPRLVLRYRTAATGHDTLLGSAGTLAHGHEFHRTRTTPGHGTVPAWRLDGDPEGFSADPARTGRPTLHASYLHTHWAGMPDAARAFADAVHDAASSSRVAAPALVSGTIPGLVPGKAHSAVHPAVHPVRAEQLLDHHGDAELDNRLADFAVNVRMAEPPSWLADLISSAVPDLAAYPNASRAREALARRHGVTEEQVLPTNGAAEAFVLIAGAFSPSQTVVVHPQFTEPEAALRRAGFHPERLVLRAGDEFRLRPGDVCEDADLVLVGNPTNPTGILHPATVLESLRRPGRVVVVDEAFMDTVGDESESLIDPDMDGLIVLRSLTKTWGIAGLRAGYAVGDPVLIAALAARQPHWSVNHLAAVAMQATSTASALREAAAATEDLARWRTHLVQGLVALGLHPVPSVTSFVLVEVGGGVRLALRERGYAVRRGDTFPGLGPSWVRIAVRDPVAADGLLREFATMLDARRRRA